MATTSINAFPTETVFVTDVSLISDVIEKRREQRVDRYDEVWEGVYVMSPGPGFDHQFFVSDLVAIFRESQIPRRARVCAGLNVTDREKDWTTNFRQPDVVVLFPDCKAKNIGSALVGGPDFIVEVFSQNDMAHDKLDFYGKVGTRECLYIDLATRAVELYQLDQDQMKLVDRSSIEIPIVLQSSVLDLSFQAVKEQNEAKVLVTNLKNPSQKWFA